MKAILIAAAIFAALVVVRVLLRLAVGHLLARLLGRIVGTHAVEQQPDTITLMPSGEQAWKNLDAARRISSPLLQRGFQNAGVYGVAEMPGLTVQLLVRPEESLLAAVYEHPKAGHWLDLVARYRDRSSITFCTSRPTGLKPRPGHPVVNDPGAASDALLERARREMPKRPLESATTGEARAIFERAYAESIAWRKQKGVSAREVADVMNRRAA